MVRKRTGTGTSARKLQNYQHVQKLLSQTMIGACQYKENANITYHKGSILNAPSYSMAEAFLNVKFYWKVLIGVLSRLPNNQHHILFKVFYTDRHYFLEEIDKEMLEEARDLFENHSEPDDKLTTFTISCPNQDMPTEKMMDVAMLLLDKYRVPDNMMNMREVKRVEAQGYNDTCRSYCNTSYWFNLINWEEIIVQDVEMSDDNI